MQDIVLSILHDALIYKGQAVEREIKMLMDATLSAVYLIVVVAILKIPAIRRWVEK